MCHTDQIHLLATLMHLLYLRQILLLFSIQLYTQSGKKDHKRQSQGVLVVPQWSTQSWYPMLLAILEQPPVVLPPA